MHGILRVLLVEDYENDALLLLNAIKRGGFEPVAERVYEAESMRAALAAREWDVILSDHAMPAFSAADALALCREFNLNTPFIIVSGRIGEESAVELMKSGAHDYVRKDDLSRLIPAINRELQSARDRVIRRRAESERAHLASIVANCEDAVISKTLDGVILSWNAGAERIYGYTADEMIGKSAGMLVPEGRTDEILSMIGQVATGQRTGRLETVRIRKDGTRIDVAMTVSPIRNSDGTVAGASIVARDITERKRQEAERSRLINELSQALARVKTLSGLLPICASCKKIRNDQGYWEQVEIYIQQRSAAEFTHGICPDCMKRLYGRFSSSPDNSGGGEKNHDAAAA